MMGFEYTPVLSTLCVLLVKSYVSRFNDGRLAQLVARFLHTEEAIGSSPVSPTTTSVSLI